MRRKLNLNIENQNSRKAANNLSSVEVSILKLEKVLQTSMDQRLKLSITG
jgi:hypothetical protein